MKKIINKKKNEIKKIKKVKKNKNKTKINKFFF